MQYTMQGTMQCTIYAIKAFARLDGIVTLVDAKHIARHLDETKPAGVVNEASAQVGLPS